MTDLSAEEIQVYRQNGYIYAINIGTKKGSFSLHGEPLTIEGRYGSGLVTSGHNHPIQLVPFVDQQDHQHCKAVRSINF